MSLLETDQQPGITVIDINGADREALIVALQAVCAERDYFLNLMFNVFIRQNPDFIVNITEDDPSCPILGCMLVIQQLGFAQQLSPKEWQLTLPTPTLN